MARTPTGVFSTAALRGLDASPASPSATTTPTPPPGSPANALATTTFRSAADAAPPLVVAASPVVVVFRAHDAQRERLVTMLRDEGTAVIACADASRLLAVLAVVKPAVLVTSARVPGLRIDPLALLATQPGYDDVPVIALVDEPLEVAQYGALLARSAVVACFDAGAPDIVVGAAVGALFGQKATSRAAGKRNPELATLRANAGWNRNPDDVAAAVARVDAIIAGDHGDVEAWFVRGQLLGELGRPAEALRALEVAAWLDPRRADTWVAFAAQLDRVGLGSHGRRAWLHAAGFVSDDATRRRIAARLGS
jgi:CheY-like chemotaxis protein